MQWNKPLYSYHEQPFVPAIFDGPLDAMPSGFNTVTIHLDGRLTADLAWKEAQKEAEQAIERGYCIFWEIELGLFRDLSLPLEHQSQHLSLSLSLDHFRDTIWQTFGAHSLGVGLYRGSVDFSLHFPWNDLQKENLKGWLEERQCAEETSYLLRCFCRDVALEYITLLVKHMPDTIPRYLMLEVPPSLSLVEQVCLLHPESFEAFGLIVKQGALPLQAIGWETPSPYGYLGKKSQATVPLHQAKLGVCLPTFCAPDLLNRLGSALSDLVGRQIPLRLIAESHLITEWDQLDDLIYLPMGLSPQGKRKLQGFCAAGGRLVTLGQKLQFAHEITWDDWISELKP